eukprot:8485090-Pyramimonas_sp.AAC.1
MSEFDPDAPWGAVCSDARLDLKRWQSELGESSEGIKDHVESLSDAVGIDQRVAGTSAGLPAERSAPATRDARGRW